MSRTKVAVLGAAGRMGHRLIHGILADNELELVGAVDAASNPQMGADIGVIIGHGPTGVLLSAHLPDQLDCLIDFSVPEATMHYAKLCAIKQIPLLVATTGFSPEQRAELIACHHQTPLLISASCSLVVNVLMKLVNETGSALKGLDFDVEIIERHHRHKVDSPSGTALKLAEIAEQAMTLTERRFGRHGLVGERPRHEIGIHAVRAGDSVGEHTVIFSTMGETLELVHRGTSRDSYVKGALVAARFLATKKPGLYTMADALGL